MKATRPSRTRTPTAKAVANKASPSRRTAKASARDALQSCRTKRTTASPSDHGASSLLTPLTSPTDDNNLDKQLTGNYNKSSPGLRFGESLRGISSSLSSEPERFRFSRSLCPCCKLGIEICTGDSGVVNAWQPLKDKLLGLVFSYDAELAGTCFAEAAESCYPERVWLETELVEAFADSRIYNLGLAIFEDRCPGSIEGKAALVVKAKKELEKEGEEEEEEEEEEDEDDSDAARIRLYKALEAEYRLEKETEEVISASATLVGLSLQKDPSNSQVQSEYAHPMDVEATDDDATLDGNETEIDERYS